MNDNNERRAKRPRLGQTPDSNTWTNSPIEYETQAQESIENRRGSSFSQKSQGAPLLAPFQNAETVVYLQNKQSETELETFAGEKWSIDKDHVNLVCFGSVSNLHTMFEIGIEPLIRCQDNKPRGHEVRYYTTPNEVASRSYWATSSTRQYRLWESRAA